MLSTSLIFQYILISEYATSSLSCLFYLFFIHLYCVLFTDQLPRSITYSLEPTSTGVSNSVKIDILASTAEVSSTTAMSKSLNSPTKHANISVADELNLLGHEIDRQMNKKANEVLELIKAYLSGTFNRSEFHGKMNDIGSVSMADLTSIAKKVIKRYKFEANPNQHYFVRMKFLQFPTSSRDLGEFKLTLIQGT